MKNSKIHVGRYWIDLYNVVAIGDLFENGKFMTYTIFMSSGAELVVQNKNGVTYEEFVKLWKEI